METELVVCEEGNEFVFILSIKINLYLFEACWRRREEF